MMTKAKADDSLTFSFPPPGWPSNAVNPSPWNPFTGPSSSYPTSRPTYTQSTPSRSNPVIPATSTYRSSPVTLRTTAPQVVHHPSTYPTGPLPFFLPPPGQPTSDPTSFTPPTSQAIRTTYPSRLRTGVTGLIQPESITGGPKERELFLAELDKELFSARPGSGASTPRYDSPAGRRPTTLSGRRTGRGGTVNYAEDGSEEEDEDEDLEEIGEAPSDPEDMDYGGGGRRRRRAAEWGGAGSTEQQAAMRAGKLRKKKEEMDRGWTWLGDRAPGDRVRSQVVRPTKHQYV